MIDAPHAPEKETITKEFFRIVNKKPDEYELFISPIGISEIEDSPEERQVFLLDFIHGLRHTRIPKSQEVRTLTKLYTDEGVLSERNLDDLTHIAYAVIARCDYIISWNMKHMVRIPIINRVNAVNFSRNYQNINITTPLLITGDTPNEND